jgi:hypothetical protein
MPAKHRILSIGEGVSCGTFKDIYSSHAKAVNFIWQRQVISLCSKALCQGYFRIILDCDDVSYVHNVTIYEGFLKLNDEVISTEGSTLYTVPDFAGTLDNPLLEQQIRPCLDLLLKLLPPLSVGALLSADSNPEHGFDQALSKSYKLGLWLLKQAEFSQAVRCFKGKGYGLTPGGDDFLAGFTLGVAIKQHSEKKSLSEIMDLLLYESLSENYLANTFLLQAYHLKPDQDWADFLLTLETSGDAPAAMQRICSQGATSGYDTLCGFFAAWETI